MGGHQHLHQWWCQWRESGASVGVSGGGASVGGGVGVGCVCAVTVFAGAGACGGEAPLGTAFGRVAGLGLRLRLG
jgi:hypothetical protein